MKRWSWLVLVLVLALGVVACGDKAELERLKAENTDLTSQVETLTDKVTRLESDLAAAKAALVAPPAVDTAAAAGDTAAAAAPTAAAAGAPIVLTRIMKKDNAYELTFNNAIAVRNVTIKSGANGEFLAFPQRDDGGQYWDYVTLDRAIGAQLLAQVKAGKSESGAASLTLSGVKIKKLEGAQGKTKAFVQFEFNGGALKVLSWSLVEGKSGLFLGTPREKSGNDWVDLVFPVDKAFRETLQQAALAEYNK